MTPTATPQQFIRFLRSIEGRGAISMQFTEIKGCAQTEPGGAIHTIAQQSGKWPGGVGADTWWFGSTEPKADTSFVALFNQYWTAGGINSLIMSMPNPVTGGPSSDTTPVDLSTLPNNPLFMAMLSSVADAIAQVQGLVTFRPVHEPNGFWFWWCTKDFAAYIAFWRFIHTYLTVTRGLKNVVWVWGVNADFGQFPPMALYPGAAYVDVVGLDVYTSTPADVVRDYHALQALGKPIILSEYGSGSASQADSAFHQTTLTDTLRNDMPEVVMWQQWWQPWGMETTGSLPAALNDPWVLNRGDLGALFAPAAIQAEMQTIRTSLKNIGTQFQALFG